MIENSRQSEIVKLINQKGKVTVKELASLYFISPSTIRRDLQELAKQNLIIKVQSGAIAVNYSDNIVFEQTDQEYRLREEVDREDKTIIAKYAAGLIKEEDVVYLDASTSVAAMIPFLPLKATYVTNSPVLAVQAAQRNLKVLVTGGELKLTTDAYTGSYAIEFLNRFNFIIGFFGTNGIHRTAQFTTPDPIEAAIKRKAFENTIKPYILATKSKFNRVAAVTFAQLSEATLITDTDMPDYQDIIKIINIGGTKK